MNYKHLLLASMALLTTWVSSQAAEDKYNNKENLMDRSIVFPAGVDANTGELTKNWYLQTFTNVNEYNDRNDRDKSSNASDRDYKDRLRDLSDKYGINMAFNPVVKTYIERYVVKNRKQVAQMLGLWSYYRPIFEREIKKQGLPKGFIYIPVACSALDPNAVAPSGAAGLWQFMILPAKGNGLEVNSLVDERRDPYKSTEKAALFLKRLSDNSYKKDWLMVLAAFNCGMGNVEKAIRRAQNQGIKSPDFWDIYKFLPKDTRGYVPAFIGACYAMNYYGKHGITPVFTKRPLSVASVDVNDRVSIHQISQYLDIPLDEIRLLNPQYRDDVIPGNIHPYPLTLPKGQINSYKMAEEKIVKYHQNEFARRVEVQPGDIKRIVGDDDIDENAKRGISFHEVTEGEDLEDIANRYGMKIQDLRSLNNLRWDDEVEPGRILTIKTKDGGYIASTNNRSNNNRSSSSSSSNYNASSNRYNSTPSNTSSSSSSSSNSSSNKKSSSTKTSSSGHNGVDQRDVPERRKVDNSEQTYVPQPQNNKNQERELAEKKKRDEEAAALKKKKKEEAEKKRKIEAEKKRKEEAAEKKRKEEAEKKRKEEEERKRREAEQPIKLTVKEGQNLTKLANQYGVSVEDIKRANGLTNDNIRIGSNILIPKKDAKGKAIIPQHANDHKQDKHQPQQQDKHQVKQQAQQQSKQQGKQQGKQQVQQQVQQHTQKPAQKPAQAATTKHTVAEGQNLTKLAKQYGVSVEDIKRANGLTNDNIRIGSNIIIPTKGKVVSAPQQGKQQAQQPKQQGKQQATTQQPKQQGKQQATQQPKQQGKQQTLQPKQPAKNNGPVKPAKSTTKKK